MYSIQFTLSNYSTVFCRFHHLCAKRWARYFLPLNFENVSLIKVIAVGRVLKPFNPTTHQFKRKFWKPLYRLIACVGAAAGAARALQGGRPRPAVRGPRGVAAEHGCP